MTLLSTGHDVLAQAKKAAPTAKAEAFLIDSEARTQEWSEGRPENEVAYHTHGLGVRLIAQGRLGFSHTNVFEPESIGACIDHARSAMGVMSADGHLDLYSMPRAAESADLDLVDESLKADRWRDRAAFLESLEAEIKKRDSRLTKVLRAGYSEGRSRVALVNSEGLAASYEDTHVSFSLACVAVENNETQIGYGFHAACHAEDLQKRMVIDSTVETALALLGGKQLPSGRYDLVFGPLVASEMLGLFANALRGDQVLKGKSFLAGHKGRPIGSRGVTIIDDGVLPRGLASSPFDADGAPRRRTVVVRDGVLEQFLYDAYTARKAGAQSTGNAGRGYKGVPEPDPSNFYLRPGTTAPDSLLAETASGIYVRNVMGLHTVDTISGDFSLGIMGERIEHGRRTHGVRGVTVAGNLLELLQNVESIGSDLTFFGSIGSPTLRIKNISVGGL